MHLGLEHFLYWGREYVINVVECIKQRASDAQWRKDQREVTVGEG